MFWGLLWGVGNLDPLLTSSHSRSVPNWPAEPESTGAVGTPSRPVSAAAQSPGHRRDALPLLAFSHSLLFSRSTVFCHQSSDGEKKTAQSPTSPSHKYACAFPEPFSAPFSSPYPHPSTGRGCNAKGFFFFFPSRDQCQRLSWTISFNTPAPAETYSLSIQFSPG